MAKKRAKSKNVKRVRTSMGMRCKWTTGKKKGKFAKNSLCGL
jgi:hypothetical protein